MLSTVVTGAAMVGVGYLIMVLVFHATIHTGLLHRWVPIAALCGCFAVMLWQIDYSWCCAGGLHLWMESIVLKREWMRRAEARQAA